MLSQSAGCSTALFSVDSFHSVVVLIFYYYCRVENQAGLLGTKLKFHFRPESISYRLVSVIQAPMLKHLCNGRVIQFLN